MGLPPLHREDVNEWVKRDAPPSTRDDLLRSEDGSPSRWIDELTERARGLPLYVHLAIEELHDGAMRVGDTLPSGLTRYLERQLARSGLDDVGHLLPMVLCVLAPAVGPLPGEAVVFALRMAGALPGVGHVRFLALVERAFERAGGWLSSESDSGGVRCWRLFHDAIRAHIQGSEALATVRSVTSEGLARLARAPMEAETIAARRWSARFGVRQLLALDRLADATALLTNAGALVDRVSLEPGDVAALLADFAEVRQRMPAVDKRLDQWSGLLRSCGAEISLIGADALVHAALTALPGSDAQGSMRDLVTRRRRSYWVRELRAGHVPAPLGRSFVWPYESSSSPKSMALSPDGRLLAILTDDRLGFIDLETGETRAPVALEQSAWSKSSRHYLENGQIAFHPNGRWILWAPLANSIGVWDVDTLACLGTSRMDLPLTPIPDLEMKANQSLKKEFERLREEFGLDESEAVGDLDATERPLPASLMSIDPSGDSVAVSGVIRMALWNLDANGRPGPSVPSSLPGSAATDRGTGRTYVAAGCALLVVMDASGPNGPTVLTGHLMPIKQITVLPGGRQVATASYDGTARVWDIDGARCMAVLNLGTEDPSAPSRVGELAAILEGDGIEALNKAAFAELRSRNERFIFGREIEGFWFGGGDEIVVLCSDRQCVLWDVATGAHRRCRRAAHGSLLMPDGRQEVYLDGGAVRVAPLAEIGPSDREITREGVPDRIFMDRERCAVGRRYPSEYVVETPTTALSFPRSVATSEGQARARPVAHHLLDTLGPYEILRDGPVTRVRDVRDDRSVSLPGEVPEGECKVAIASRRGLIAWRTPDGAVCVQELSPGASVTKIEGVTELLEIRGWVAQDRALLLLARREDSFFPVLYLVDSNEFRAPPSPIPGALLGIDDACARVVTMDREGRLAVCELLTGRTLVRSEPTPIGSNRWFVAFASVPSLDVELPEGPSRDGGDESTPDDDRGFRYFELIPGTSLLFDASPDGRLTLWDIETCEARHRATGPPQPALAPVYCSEQQRLVYLSGEGVFSAWNLGDGTVTSCVPPRGADLICPMNERTVAVVSDDGIDWYRLISPEATG